MWAIVMQIAICDDSQTDLQQLKGIIQEIMERYSVCYSIHEYESGEMLLDTSLIFHLVFLDIVMNGGKDGIEIGKQIYRTDYPMTAVREALINALVHRDYSIHTEGMPIQILMFEDRMEIHNPGGIYGRLRTDQLGKMQPDTRNPVLAAALEVLGITENRYSGIPTIRRAFAEYGMRAPDFTSERGHFVVTFYKEAQRITNILQDSTASVCDLLAFCKTPRTRKEICDYLGLSSMSYAIQIYIMPLVEQGLIKLTIPDKPKSPKQLYYS